LTGYCLHKVINTTNANENAGAKETILGFRQHRFDLLPKADYVFTVSSGNCEKETKNPVDPVNPV